MGTLKPNTQYVYESPDNGKSVYAREVGTTDRQLVGYSYDELERRKKHDQLKMWEDILKKSETNEALKKALDNAILIYSLVKEENKEELYVRV